MDTTEVFSLLAHLDDEVDDLEDSLQPLLKTTLSETSSKLPLLDKAKLYVLVTYTIESILFSYLRLNGVKAREHPVFTELTRVKQYFEKVKLAETPTEKRGNLSLDKGAASRFIKAGLAGNERYDLKRADEQAKKRARAHIKFNVNSENLEQDELCKKRKVEVFPPDSTSLDSDSSSMELPVKSPASLQSLKKKRTKLSANSSDSMAPSASENPKSKKKDKKSKRESKV